MLWVWCSYLSRRHTHEIKLAVRWLKFWQRILRQTSTIMLDCTLLRYKLSKIYIVLPSIRHNSNFAHLFSLFPRWDNIFCWPITGGWVGALKKSEIPVSSFRPQRRNLRIPTSLFVGLESSMVTVTSEVKGQGHVQNWGQTLPIT